jgi:hypothetical protein
VSDEWVNGSQDLTPDELRELEERARARLADPSYQERLQEIDRLNAVVTRPSQ